MKSRASRWFFVALTGVVALAASCSREPDSERATRKLLETEAVYRGPDVRGAEAALLAYVEHLTEARRRNVPGHDYPFGLGMTHGRLFLLYRHTGQQDLMRSHFSMSVAHLRSWREAQKLPQRPLDADDLAQWVEDYDGGSEVQWKSNQPEGRGK